MEKLKPHYALASIKAAFGDPERLNRSYVSRQGADNLGMDTNTVVAVIQALGGAVFDKPLPWMADHKVWQDVYKPNAAVRTFYVKFARDARLILFLIRFKDA